MNVHPVARLFPPMSDAQYAALRDDIKANGQLEPITLWRGLVIDGVHRARACEELERKPLVREWTGEESGLIVYVVSLNLHRRHLNESQRGFIADKISFQNLNQSSLAREADRKGAPRPIDLAARMPTDQAAALLNVSPATVKRARVVREGGVPELVAAVERGEMSVYPASEIARLPEAEQRTALGATRPRSQHLSRHPMLGTVERIHRTVESLSNLAEILAEAMPSMNGDKRRSEWAGRLRNVRTTVSRFIAECER